MIFIGELTIPKDTAKGDPVSQPLPVAKGLVYRVSFRFPKNLLGLAGIAVCDGSFQLWPTTPDKWFHSENETITFDDPYLKNAAPYIFMLRGYNEDDTFEHTIQVRIGLVSEELFQARFMPHLAWKDFQKMMLNMAKEQEETYQKIRETAFDYLKETE